MFINNIPNSTIEFYETEDDREKQINALSSTYLVTNPPQTLYIGITSPTCYEINTFEINLNNIDVFTSIDNQTVCDEDQDGITTINSQLPSVGPKI